jgi:endonuclease-3 related protein
MNRRNLLMNMFQAMHDSLGPSHWWPGETPFEVAVGAILTQNAAWSNVEKAIANLKAAGVFDPRLLHGLPDARLAELIRPSGYFRLKAGRLKNLLAFLKNECGYDLRALAGRDLPSVREKLLAVRGIGPETADSILLYALDYPTFVVDAYTRRLLSRHGLVPEEATYEECANSSWTSWITRPDFSTNTTRSSCAPGNPGAARGRAGAPTVPWGDFCNAP